MPQVAELRPPRDAAQARRVVARRDIAALGDVHRGNKTKRLTLPAVPGVCHAPVVGDAEHGVERVRLWETSGTAAGHPVGLQHAEHAQHGLLLKTTLGEEGGDLLPLLVILLPLAMVHQRVKQSSNAWIPLRLPEQPDNRDHGEQTLPPQLLYSTRHHLALPLVKLDATFGSALADGQAAILAVAHLPLLPLLEADSTDWGGGGEKGPLHKSPISKNHLASLDVPRRHQAPAGALDVAHRPQLALAAPVVEAKVGGAAS